MTQPNALSAMSKRLNRLLHSIATAALVLGLAPTVADAATYDNVAAKNFFTWALGQFGYSLGEIEGIISRGVAILSEEVGNDLVRLTEDEGDRSRAAGRSPAASR